MKAILNRIQPTRKLNKNNKKAKATTFHHSSLIPRRSSLNLHPSYLILHIFLLLFLTACGGQTQQLGQPEAPAVPSATPPITAAPGDPTASAPLIPIVSPTPDVGGAAPTAAPPAASPSPAAAVQATPTSAEFQNPIFRVDFPDPFVLNVDGTYYAYATNGSGRNIQVARSEDLIQWTLLPDALPALPTWARLGNSLVWAPEVLRTDSQFILYYTARDKESNRQCLGVATSERPQGPFRDTNERPFICQASEGGSIDASPFRDTDGQLYLYWKNDGNCCGIPTYLYVQPLAPDGLSLQGEPTRLVRNDAAWEGRVVEAPTMWQHDGKYYLFFSGNNYAGFEYAVGYATCAAATGPCEDSPANPILASQMERRPLVIGPGHQTIVQDKNDTTWLVYHVWEVTSAGTRGSRRFMYMDQLIWNGDQPDVNGPTTGPQARP
jgi:beta-xylosidase